MPYFSSKSSLKTLNAKVGSVVVPDFEITLTEKSLPSQSLIVSAKALEEINALWRDYEKEWVHCGIVYKIKKEHFCFGKAKEHRFLHRYTNAHGEQSTFQTRYFLCMFHGKLCWVQHSHYYPRMELYKFTNLDTEPSYTDFIQWTSINNIKNVYWKNFEGKWEVV